MKNLFLDLFKYVRELRVVVYNVPEGGLISFEKNPIYDFKSTKEPYPRYSQHKVEDRVFQVEELLAKTKEIPRRKIEGAQEEFDPLQSIDLDLSPYLKDKYGHLIIYIEPTKVPSFTYLADFSLFRNQCGIEVLYHSLLTGGTIDLIYQALCRILELAFMCRDSLIHWLHLQLI